MDTTVSTLTSLDPTGIGVGVAVWVIATVLALYMIPALLVGLLAEMWDRRRTSWALFAFFLGWPIALATLLIIGRSEPYAPPTASMPAPSAG
jgi:hypothetical protein